MRKGIETVKNLFMYIFLAVLFFIGVGAFWNGEKPLERQATDQTKEEPALKAKEDDNGLKKEEATIKQVIDGDTVEVNLGLNKEERIRLLLIDTPESVHPELGKQLFGLEASNYAKSYLKRGKKVTVEIGNPERDEYGRMLAYIWIDDVNFNKHMIEKGFARVAYVFPPNTKYLKEFQEAEKVAKLNRIGIWSIDGYVTEKGFDMSVAEEENINGTQFENK